jgi:hypothetical protein
VYHDGTTAAVSSRLASDASEEVRLVPPNENGAVTQPDIQATAANGDVGYLVKGPVAVITLDRHTTHSASA